MQFHRENAGKVPSMPKVEWSRVLFSLIMPKTRTSPSLECSKVKTNFASLQRSGNFRVQPSPVLIVLKKPHTTSILTDAKSSELFTSTFSNFSVADSHMACGNEVIKDFVHHDCIKGNCSLITPHKVLNITELAFCPLLKVNKL